MKKIFFVSLVLMLLCVTFVSAGNYDKNLSSKLKGKLLLATEDKGRIWYISPTDLKRYEVTFGNALPLFEKLALGISNKDLEAISEVKSTVTGNRLKGRLLLQVEDRGRIWYIDTGGMKHEVTWGNLMSLFRRLALGITNGNLDKIEQNIEKDSVVQILQNISAKFGVYNPQINNNITFEYRLYENSFARETIIGKSIVLKNIIVSKDGGDTITYNFESLGLEDNNLNVGDGVGISIIGFNNSEIACLTYKTNMMQTGYGDLEIKCGKIKMQTSLTMTCNNDLYHSDRSQYDFWKSKFLFLHPDYNSIYDVGSYCELNDGTKLVSFSHFKTTDPTSAGQTIALFDSNNNLIKQTNGFYCQTLGDLGTPKLDSIDNNKLRARCASGDAGLLKTEIYEINLSNFTYILLSSYTERL